MERILILDDEPEMVENCRRILSREGYQCLTATDARQALAMLGSERPDLLLTDLRMPDMDGMELLRAAKQVDPHLPVIMLTAFASIESAVNAVRSGAFDYLSKPFTMEELKVSVERALTQRQLARENLHLREQLKGVYGFENIIGRSAAMQQVLELVRKAARSEANIVVLGESGTGKELIAHAIHANSSRAAQAFVAVDCASLPENLLESELFGHERGAFTGAVRAKQGLIELADRGTLLLDEIAELPIGLQSKLLRALQEHEIRRVGGTRQLDVDIRVVSASSRDLPAMVSSGRFREDLFYRINVIDIALPPLRERIGDVKLLAYGFLEKNMSTANCQLKGIAPEALAMLEAYSWPGNVRELQNLIERACALADGEMIMPADLPRHIRLAQSAQAAPPASDETETLTLKEAKERWIGQLESAYVANVLKREGGNVSQAARVAGVDRKTLHRLLSKHKLR